MILIIRKKTKQPHKNLNGLLDLLELIIIAIEFLKVLMEQ